MRNDLIVDKITKGNKSITRLQANRVSLCWLQRSFPELPGLKSFLDDHQIEILQDHMLATLASEDLAGVAKVLVYLATCFQQTPP